LESRCIDIERIGEVVDLPANDPLRQHVEDCPRCRNLLRSYQKFLRAEPVAGFDSAAARRRLDALISTRVGGTRSAPASPFANFLRGFLRPVPLVAAAAVCVVVALTVWQRSRGPEEILLREEPALRALTLAPAEVRADGSIHLSWSAVSGADAYQVRIYGPSLTVIHRAEVAVTSIVIDRSLLPPNLPPSLDLMWRVAALQAGDTIQVSSPGSVRTR
jgi:hypothetical protein